MIKDLGLEQHSSETVWFALAGWLVLSMGLILAPLLVFILPLYALRERALIEYGRLVSQHHLAFHRKWIEGNRNGNELVGSPDPSSASDLNATVELVQQVRCVPADLPAVLGLVVAAGVPLLAVIATQIPVIALLKWVVGSIF